MIIHGVNLVDDRDMVVAAMRRDGSFEPESMARWLAALKPGHVAIDVGAYTGLYAIAAALAGSAVMAYEPNPTVFARLQQNVMLNGVEVEYQQLAAGNEHGFRSMWIAHGHMTSAGRLDQRRGGEEIQVRIGRVLSERPVSVMKLDVEGHELEVLRGAHAILERDRPVVIAEALTEGEADQLVVHMSQYGYMATHADERNLVFEVADG